MSGLSLNIEIYSAGRTLETSTSQVDTIVEVEVVASPCGLSVSVWLASAQVGPVSSWPIAPEDCRRPSRDQA